MSNDNYPEITIKAVFLGIILSMVLAGANAYLGLFAGMTVSASIPAAVISMGVLSLFKNYISTHNFESIEEKTDAIYNKSDKNKNVTNLLVLNKYDNKLFNKVNSYIKQLLKNKK